MNDSQSGQEPVVLVENLVKVFRDFWHRPKIRAVDGINLEIRGGEVFGLLGPNGSGKSTTIKIILGLLHATSGSVSLLGRPPHHVASKSAVGYLPEESHLYNYLTPRETLHFYGNLFGIPAAERKLRTDQLLEMVGLSGAADRPVGEFSKGMARRVGLAQALINDPKVIILDEPTSGLDPIACRQVKDLIHALAARGKTILLSSHLLADVEDVCNRVAILFDGKVQAMGEVASLLEKKDRVRLTIPAMSAERLRDVLASVRDMTGSSAEVDHPSMTLERYFIEVIERAGTATAGAASTGKLAGYLTHE